MKHIFLFPLLGLIFMLPTTASRGQENKDLRLCINAGITYSNTIGKGTVDDSWINGYPPDCYTNSSAGKDFLMGKKFGIGLLKELNKIFSVGFDLNYEEKGCKIPITHLSYVAHINGSFQNISKEVDERSSIRLKYIVLPIKFEARHKMLYFQSGLYTGVLIDADDYGKINVDGQEFEFNRDKDSRYSRVDVGVLISTGVAVPISEKDILKFGLSGNWNLTGNESRGMIPGYKDDWYNQSFSFEIRFERIIK
ncbi:MAG: outer membrane beta-barrel protein [Bacteroidota bacterium]